MNSRFLRLTSTLVAAGALLILGSAKEASAAYCPGPAENLNGGSVCVFKGANFNGRQLTFEAGGTYGQWLSFKAEGFPNPQTMIVHSPSMVWAWGKAHGFLCFPYGRSHLYGAFTHIYIRYKTDRCGTHPPQP